MQSFLKTYNPICPVHFAGFESNTLRLQKAGWQLSMHQDYSSDSMRLALRHEGARLHAMSHPVSFLHMMHLERQRPDRGLDFHIMWLGGEARFQIMPIQASAVSWSAIDATPQFLEHREVAFEDLIPFKPINHNAPEIVIAQHSVPELMELIVKLQDPKQKEIRDKARKEAWRRGDPSNELSEGYNPVADIRAQIISLAA